MAHLGLSSSQTSFLDSHTYTHGDSVPGLSGDDNDDQWSVRDTVDTDEQSLVGAARRQQLQEIAEHGQDDLTIRGAKIATDPKELASPVMSSNIEATTPTSTGPDPTSDIASTRSLPVVQVTSPQSPTRPSTAHTSNLASSPTPADPLLSSNVSGSHRSMTSQERERRNRHRATVDVRASNRISGFFSNLMHRRDPQLGSSMRQGTQEEEEPSSAPSRQISGPPTRTSSPVRPATPPPALPPPSLQDLGLSLSSITSVLSPSHFTTPPSSGAFLAPHYLLLCHAQGLDVVPLVSPPAPQPYALVRRVSFKSVVVMEHRGVLVAIAGRRDGVRVYALEEVKKAVEWRIEVEVRREAERKRREEAKRHPPGSAGRDSSRTSSDKHSKAKLSISSSGGLPPPEKSLRKASSASASSVHTPPQSSSSRHQVKKRKSTPQVKAQPQPVPQVPAGPPPSYSSSIVDRPRPNRDLTTPVPFDQARARRTSVTDVLTGPLERRNVSDDAHRDQTDVKGDWSDPRHSSDDEAINLVSAGPSGSEAYDERTSAMTNGSASSPTPATAGNGLARVEIPPMPPTPGRALSTQLRRSRPSNLDLASVRSHTSSGIPAPHPSPTPTLMSLRQALSVSPDEPPDSAAMTENMSEPASPTGDVDDDDDGMVSNGQTPREEITLAQALMESRIPELPPVGSRRPQQPILITASHPVATGEDEPASPRTSEGHSIRSSLNPPEQRNRRRRRWSVLDLVPHSPLTSTQAAPVPEAEVQPTPADAAAIVSMAERRHSRLVRSQSFRSQASALGPVTSATRPSSSPGNSVRAATLPGTDAASAQGTRASSRFISRFIQDVLHPRRDESSQTTAARGSDSDARRTANGHTAPHAPAPKLEYVKLPGTKGALLIKAVETAKKSFLAILCGDNGEKVELFAGTYRTALGLSRTFILPDSPRSLELQLQGDDLVEVFLVFSQNVFGLEPATVRVREVRIGRAERRAARRRARENRAEDSSGAGADAENAHAAEDDTNVNVSIGVPASDSNVAIGGGATAGIAAAATNSPFGPPPAEDSQTSAEPSNPTTSTSTEELVALATAHMGPYTTFQQLSFSPNFPLAAVADEYTIPPTYPSFLQYRAEHEPEVNGSANVDLAQVNFSPPGLPVPSPTAPSMWYYRDPKGIVHGPWKASLMQAWYKDGLLPPDLPVRREEDTEFILLRDLRLQSVDPSHPFRPTPPPMNVQATSIVQEPAKPLLHPISLLSQPRHFGPPALFYSSRGGHSTAIVDARGRSVLKSRFVWTPDEDDDASSVLGRMGDVKHLEAFDVKDRAVLVAMRQGGLEAVDFGDALLKPADESRTALPNFNPSVSVINRRGPFVWRIGMPITSIGSAPSGPGMMSSRAGSRQSGKKGSTGPSKSPGRTDFSFGPDPTPDNQIQEEVLFLGRKDDEIYLCERRTGSFRILRLSPTTA